MTLHEIRVLFEYDAWATDRTLESVSSLPERTYLEDRKSSHGGIHGTLVHILRADTAWLQRWSGTPVKAVEPADIPDFKTLAARWKEYHRNMRGCLRGITEAALAEPFIYTDTRGTRQSDPLVQQMQQLVNHSSYHRGQVVTMLRQAGGTPVPTDLIMFYRTTPTKSIGETLEGQNY